MIIYVYNLNYIYILIILQILFFKKMNYTINEQKRYESKKINKPNILVSINNLKTQRVIYNNQQDIAESINEYFSLTSFEYFRINQFKKLIEIKMYSTTTDYQNSVDLTILKELINIIIQCYETGYEKCRDDRLYQIFKWLICCYKTTLNSILSCIIQERNKILVYAIIFSITMFKSQKNIFLTGLQKGYLLIKKNKILIDFIKRKFQADVVVIKLQDIVKNIKRLLINSQEFRGFIIELFSELLVSKEKEIEEQFERYLKKLLENQQKSEQISSDIEIIFEQFEVFSKNYFKIIKKTINQLMATKKYAHIYLFHQKLTEKLKNKEYFQLINLYTIVLREWLNQNNNCLIVLTQNFRDIELRNKICVNFLPYIQNFKQIQNLVVKLYIKNTYDIQTEKIFINLLQTTIGYNYTSNIHLIIKDIQTLKQNQIIPNLLTYKIINKTVYPKQWNQFTFTMIFENKQILNLIKQHKQIYNIVNKLKQFEEKLKKKNSEKSYTIVNHQIVVNVDGKNCNVSLQILLWIIQLMLAGELPENKIMKLSNNISVISSVAQKISNTALKLRITKQNLIDDFYVNHVSKISEQKKIDQVPPYVIEGKIIKILKKNKSLSFQQISQQLNSFKPELINVMLQNLIKKDYAELKNQIYTYVP